MQSSRTASVPHAKKKPQGRETAHPRDPEKATIVESGTGGEMIPLKTILEEVVRS